MKKEVKTQPRVKSRFNVYSSAKAFAFMPNGVVRVFSNPSRDELDEETGR